MQKNILGIALIIVGIIIVAYTRFNFVTTEKVVEIGHIKISNEKDYHVQWPSLVGFILIVGGIVVIVRDKKVCTQ